MSAHLWNHSIWSGRSVVIASLIRDEIVIDLGAGPCALKLLIPNSYAAYDITGDVAYLDLNAELPQWTPGNYCAVLSGVLEYLDRPLAVLSWVSTWAKAVVLSYAFYGDRERNGWVNELSRDELLLHLYECGGVVEDEVGWLGQSVFRVTLAH